MLEATLRAGDAVSRVSMQTLVTASSSHVGAHPSLAVGRCKFTLAAFSRGRLESGNNINVVGVLIRYAISKIVPISTYVSIWKLLKYLRLEN